MANILVPFVYKDEEIIEELCKHLEKLHHEVEKYRFNRLTNLFLDDNEKILNKVKSADFLLVIFSGNTQKDEEFISEVSKAIGYCRERKIPMLPVVFDEAPIPDIIYSSVYLKASREELSKAASGILNIISQALGKSEAIEEEKKKTIARVNENADTYIQDSITRLEKKEKIYQVLAYICYSLCGVSLIIAVVLLLFKANYILTVELTTPKQIQLGLIGFVLLALMISISRFMFLIGKSFMVESLRNSDRIHAISFGKFYLKAYGDEAKWDEIKEAFQHWNIDKGSAFISQSANDFDPEIFKNIIEFTKVITKKS